MAEETFEYLKKKKLVDLNTTEATCRVDTEIILPEYKAEAERLIRAYPKIVVKNKSYYRREHKLFCELEGAIGFHVLYQKSERSEGVSVSSYLHTEPFSHTFQIPLAGEELLEEDMALFVEATPRSSLIKLLGPRKMSAKCEVLLSLSVKGNQNFYVFPSKPAEDLITSTEEIKLASLKAVYSEEMSFSQTISLPKAYLPVDEICEMEAVLLPQKVKSEEGGVSFLGICDLHCSYTASDENLFVSFYQPIEFERRVGSSEISAESFSRVNLTPTALKASAEINEDGENRNVLFELDFLCEVFAYENERLEVTCDAFSTRNHVLLEKNKEETKEFVGVFDFSDEIKARVPSKNPEMTRAEGICSSVEIRNSYLEEGKICLEGKLNFSYLGIAETGEMKNCEESNEFRTCLTPPFSIPEGEECSVEVCGCARGVDVEPEGEELRLKFDLCGSITVYKTCRADMICRLERGDEIIKKRGEIIYVYPREGEDLWSLSKEYHISPELVCEQNHLTGDTLPMCLKLIR